ncbi:MAG: hypothetical protein IID46_15755 [Planctomycetes bacterium]|nr:hypothetical protein [Planctomycetota bacterium]
MSIPRSNVDHSPTMCRVCLGETRWCSQIRFTICSHHHSSWKTIRRMVGAIVPAIFSGGDFCNFDLLLFFRMAQAIVEILRLKNKEGGDMVAGVPYRALSL